jgi:uncharacterized SAM-binding protein YcdF (DUF218 family)
MRAHLNRVLRWMAAAFAVVALAGVAGWPVYVHPQVDELRRADAIVVLGGTAYDRFDLGLDLAQRGYAPELLISRSTGVADTNMNKFCDGHFSFMVDCFEPNPWTTQGEAQEINRRAKQRSWQHIIVVTFTPHVSRARYIVRKCFDGELTMIASPSPSGLWFWTRMYVRQSLGFLRAFCQHSC